MSTKFDIQIGTMSCIDGCFDSIKNEMQESHRPLNPSQYMALSLIYELTIELQKWVVFNEPPKKLVKCIEL